MTPAEQGKPRYGIGTTPDTGEGKTFIKGGTPTMIDRGEQEEERHYLYRSDPAHGWSWTRAGDSARANGWEVIEIVPADQARRSDDRVAIQEHRIEGYQEELARVREELAQAMQIIRGEGIGESLLAAEADNRALRAALIRRRNEVSDHRR